MEEHKYKNISWEGPHTDETGDPVVGYTSFVSELTITPDLTLLRFRRYVSLVYLLLTLRGVGSVFTICALTP